MIKIKAKVDLDNDIFKWEYKPKNTNTLEHLMTICNLVDIILENQENITEKEIMNIVKNRKKYLESLGEK